MGSYASAVLQKPHWGAVAGHGVRIIGPRWVALTQSVAGLSKLALEEVVSPVYECTWTSDGDDPLSEGLAGRFHRRTTLLAWDADG